MTVNVSPEQVAKFELERKSKAAEAQALIDECTRQRQISQAIIKAKREAARQNEIHTASDDYTCENCGHTIPKGSKYRRQNVKVGFGWPEGFKYASRITHLVCSTEANRA